MARKPKRTMIGKTSAHFADPAVGAVFAAYPDAVRPKLMALRQLIFATAEATEGVGFLVETLKWGQPSYLTPETKSGSTIRIDRIKSGGGDYALYFHCQTDLIESFRARFDDQLTFEGNRAILFKGGEALPALAVRDCVAQALTYHLRKRRRG